jgi:uncharacterized membrane protein YqjE
MSMREPEPTGLFDSLGRLANAGLGLVHNRAELLSVELQEEKTRLLETLLWMAVVLFFGIVFTLVLTATIIMIFPQEVRIYAGGAFCVLYLIGAIWALGQFRSRMSGPTPLDKTVDETRKDRDVFISELA